MSSEKQEVKYEVTLTFEDPAQPPFVFKGVVPSDETTRFIPEDLQFYTLDAQMTACERAYNMMKEAILAAKPTVRFSAERVVRNVCTVRYDPAYPEAKRRAEEMMREEKRRAKQARRAAHAGDDCYPENSSSE